MSFIVAIDGPAGTGKGTIANLISMKFGFINIDTGAMYRCVTLEILRNNVQLDDIKGIEAILENIDIKFKHIEDKDFVFLNGENVTEIIRTKDVNENVSQVAKIKEVREKMVDLQRKLGDKENVVMEGRDIGTVVFPNANVKIYLDATSEERAKRRFIQNKEKNIDMSYEEILENIKLRDENDKTRKIGALKIADDAVVIDTTNLSINEVMEQVVKLIQEKM